MTVSGVLIQSFMDKDMSDKIIVFPRKQLVFEKVAQLLRQSVADIDAFNPKLKAFVPHIGNEVHWAYITGMWAGYILGLAQRLKEAASEPEREKYLYQDPQQMIFGDFLKDIEFGKPFVRFCIWYENGLMIQIMFIKMEDGSYFPFSIYKDQFNFFDHLIIDCAKFFNVPENDIVSIHKLDSSN